MRSSVNATTVRIPPNPEIHGSGRTSPDSRTPDTEARYMAPGAGDPLGCFERPLQRPHKPGRRKIVPGDGSLKVGRGDEGHPGGRRGLEAQWPPPADEVIDECRDLAGLT